MKIYNKNRKLLFDTEILGQPNPMELMEVFKLSLSSQLYTTEDGNTELITMQDLIVEYFNRCFNLPVKVEGV